MGTSIKLTHINPDGTDGVSFEIYPDDSFSFVDKKDYTEFHAKNLREGKIKVKEKYSSIIKQIRKIKSSL